MDGSHHVPFGKRQRESEPAERYGRNKRRNQVAVDNREQQAMPSPDDTTYRILCPGVKVGSVIGKSGNVIKSIRHETHARVKITDAVPGVDERVILIWSSPKELEKGNDKNGGREGKNRDRERNGGVNEDEEKGDGNGALEKEEFLCPAQEALFRVLARIVEEEGNGSDEDDNDSSQQVTARLLVPNNQIGCLLGKGGKVIEKMRNETGAQIRILPKDQVPGCALPSDELVQISGDPALVKKALHEISARIHENPPRGRPQGTASFLAPGSMLPPGGPMLPPGGPMPFSNVLPPNMLPPNVLPTNVLPPHVLPPGNPLSSSTNLGGPLFGLGPSPFSGVGGFGFGEPGSTWHLTSPPVPVLPSLSTPIPEPKEPLKEEEFTIQLLCPNDKVGIIIGKGGNAIRQLRESMGVRIKVENSVPESEERVIVISANEYLNRSSPVIETVLHLQVKASTYGGDAEGQITTRLLVPSKQVGCLLGKRGSVISEMRKKTTANIKVLQKVDLPKCAQETDELVQIIGDINIAKEALVEVLTRLRNSVFREQIEERSKSVGFPTASLPGFAMQGSLSATPSSFSSWHEPGSPGRMYPMNGLGLQEGGRYASSFQSLGLMQGFGSGLDVGGGLSSGSGMGTLSSYGGGSYGGGSYGEGFYTGRSTGGGSGVSDGLLKNISGSTVEVTIPVAAVSSVVGKGGNNISQIRQISGAKIKLHESRTGAGDLLVEIFGTPEQTQAAQSLLQAFISSGLSSAGSGLRGVY